MRRDKAASQRILCHYFVNCFIRCWHFIHYWRFVNRFMDKRCAREKSARSSIKRASRRDKPLLRCLLCEGIKQLHREDFVLFDVLVFQGLQPHGHNILSSIAKMVALTIKSRKRDNNIIGNNNAIVCTWTKGAKAHRL